MNQFRTIFASILFLFALAACGQSGPLYIPGNPSEVQVPPGQPQPPAEPEEDDDSDDDDDE